MWLHVLVFFTTFCFMEFMAWFSHKYIMHGFLWSLHRLQILQEVIEKASKNTFFRNQKYTYTSF